MKITDEMVDVATQMYEKLSNWADSLGDDAERECMRAALEAAMQHAKPEAVRLRDELRERAELVALIVRGCCESEPSDPDHSDTVCINVNDLEEVVSTQLKSVVMEDDPLPPNNQSADLAATGKQQVGDPKCSDCGTPLLYECTGCSATNYPPQQVGEVISIPLIECTDANGNHVGMMSVAKDGGLTPQGYATIAKSMNQVGEVQGDTSSPNEMANALERIAGGALSDYKGVEADEMHILRCAKLIRDLSARQPVSETDAYQQGFRDGQDRTCTVVARQPVGQEPVADLTGAFLSDVVTAAGLLCNGGQSKALASRISAEAYRLLELRAAPPAQAVDLGQLERIRNELHAMSAQVPDEWADPIIELQKDVQKVIDSQAVK